MSVLRAQLRSGEYHDSIVLMQLQLALAELPGVQDAGAVMATESNLALLAANRLLPGELGATRPEDLVIAVRASGDTEAESALAQVNALLARRREALDTAYRPHTLEAALEQLPEARWVLISVPGRYATGVARRALELGLCVFLYSDNVPPADELELKRKAAARGLLVMGPDCGTASIAGVGLGFANHTRRGSIGLVSASGTGLQTIASRIEAAASENAHPHDSETSASALGISQAIGTGGRDLDDRIGGLTARAGLALLGADPQTRVIVLVSKPPSPAVAADLLAGARQLDKPVVVCLQGTVLPRHTVGNLWFARGLGHAADLAIGLTLAGTDTSSETRRSTESGRYLRALFSGGTLAYEAALELRHLLPQLHTNLDIAGLPFPPSAAASAGHTVLDLGSDEYTVGRLHPMIDYDSRRRRLLQESEDLEVAVILLDVVLGHGAHPDPAAELAEAVATATSDRGKTVIITLIGTAGDPQRLALQKERLEQAGALVFIDLDRALARALEALPLPDPDPTPAETVSPAALAPPFAAINVGLEIFGDSVRDQRASLVQLDWRPPAGGNERLQEILAALSTDAQSADAQSPTGEDAP